MMFWRITTEMDNISCLEGLIRRGTLDMERWRGLEGGALGIRTAGWISSRKLLGLELVWAIVNIFGQFGHKIFRFWKILGRQNISSIYIDSCSSSSAPTPSLQDELFQSVGSLQQDGGGWPEEGSQGKGNAVLPPVSLITLFQDDSMTEEAMKQAKEELKSQSSTKVKKRAKIGFNKTESKPAGRRKGKENEQVPMPPWHL